MPAALAGAEGIAVLALIVSFVVLLGLQKGWSATFGWIFRTLADSLAVIGILGVHPFRKVASWLRSLDHNVYHALGVAALGCEHAASWLWHQTANQVAWIGREIADLAHDTAQALGAVNTTIVKPAVKIVDTAAKLRIAAVAAAVATITKIRLPALTRAVALVKAQVARLTHTVAVDVRSLGVKVGVTAKQLRRLGARVGKLEAAVAGLGAVALVGTALGRMGLSWLRCPSLGRLGRGIGCNGFAALEELIAPAFEALLAVELCAFARLSQQVAHELAPQLGVLLLAQDVICLGGGESLPSASDDAHVHLTITLPSAV